MRGSRTFCQGGGWGYSDGWTAFFLFCFLLVLNLFYSLQRGSKDRGGSTFLGGWGSRVQVLISIEIHITCDFPGGGGGGGSGPPITLSGSAHGLIAG